jgi:hypothetical protein
VRRVGGECVEVRRSQNLRRREQERHNATALEGDAVGVLWSPISMATPRGDFSPHLSILARVSELGTFRSRCTQDRYWATAIGRPDGLRNGILMIEQHRHSLA